MWEGVGGDDDDTSEDVDGDDETDESIDDDDDGEYTGDGP